MQISSLFLVGTLALATPLTTYSVSDAEGAIEDGWPLISFDRDEQCEVQVTGNGKFYRISISGLEPGEVGNFRLTNENIKPIDYDFRSDGNGHFSKIYLPFLWHHRGGTVSVSLTAEDCDVALSFPWSRIPGDSMRDYDLTGI